MLSNCSATSHQPRKNTCPVFPVDFLYNCNQRYCPKLDDFHFVFQKFSIQKKTERQIITLVVCIGLVSWNHRRPDIHCSNSYKEYPELPFCQHNCSSISLNHGTNFTYHVLNNVGIISEYNQTEYLSPGLDILSF